MTEQDLSDQLSVAHDIAQVLTEIDALSWVHAVIRSQLWQEKAAAFLRSMWPVYLFLRSHQDPHFTLQCIRENFELDVAEAFAWDEPAHWGGREVRPAGYFGATYGRPWAQAVRPLQSFITHCPGYDPQRHGRQKLETKDQYQFIGRQLARLCCDAGGAGVAQASPPIHRLPAAAAVYRILMLETGRKENCYEKVTDHRREKFGSF